MAKKRKSDANRLDEVERSLHSIFCSAANSLSQIYTEANKQKKVSIQAGERHALEKLYQWILRKHEETSRVTTADILAYLEQELDSGGGDDTPTASPRYTGSIASPIRQSLHSFYQGNGSRNSERVESPNRNKGSTSNDSSMDMH